MASQDLIDKKVELAKLKRLYSHQMRMAYSADNPDSRPTAEQMRCIQAIKVNTIRWVVAANRSGKSQVAAREISWLFMNSHPFFDKEKEWGQAPITMAILSKKTDIMERELWEKKVKPLVSSSNYKEIQAKGGGLAAIKNMDNGNMIIFQSHNNPEEARKNIQGYALHYVWLDEMPESASLVTELVMRVSTTKGKFIATFTPLVKNQEIKNMVENAKEPIAGKFFFSMFDNPTLQDRIDRVIEEIRMTCSTEEEFRCRVYGEWMTAGKTVSCYNPDLHKVKLPEYYSKQWRHMLVVDPSASGITGMTLWAEDETTGQWLCVMSEQVQGAAAYLLVKEIEKKVAGFNIVKRLCDPNPAGFYMEAARQGIYYQTVQEKAGRKADIIDNSNKMLSQGRMKLTELSVMLEHELMNAQWNETGDKIIKASSWHCFDTFQYAADSLPEGIVYKEKLPSWEHELRRASIEQRNKPKENKKYAIMKYNSGGRRWR